MLVSFPATIAGDVTMIARWLDVWQITGNISGSPAVAGSSEFSLSQQL
jgi:hypothetical protein